MTKVWIVVRTKPSLAIVGTFSSKPRAEAFIHSKGLSACIVEEWSVQ